MATISGDYLCIVSILPNTPVIADLFPLPRRWTHRSHTHRLGCCNFLISYCRELCNVRKLRLVKVLWTSISMLGWRQGEACLNALLVNTLNRFYKCQSVTFNKEKLKNPNETSWKTYKSFWIDADSAPGSRQRKQRHKVGPGDLICPY